MSGNDLTLYERRVMADLVDNPHRPASSYSDTDLMRVAQSGLLRGGLVALEETLRARERELEQAKRIGNKLAEELSGALDALRHLADNYEELEQAARDVLPSFSRMGPLPEWHPVAALRRLLEEGR